MESQVSKQLDYKQSEYVHPDYRLTKLLPQSGLQLFNLTNTGAPDTYFEIPTKVFNLARSHLFFTLPPNPTTFRILMVMVFSFMPPSPRAINSPFYRMTKPAPLLVIRLIFYPMEKEALAVKSVDRLWLPNDYGLGSAPD